MAHYSVTVSSPLSQTEAWRRLSDVTRFSEWEPGVISAEQIGDQMGAEATYLLTVKGIRKNIEMTYNVAHFSEPERLILLADTGTIRSEDEIEVVATVAGCDVTYTVDLSLYGRAAIFNPVMSLVFKRIGERAASGLQRHLEAV